MGPFGRGEDIDIKAEASGVQPHRRPHSQRAWETV